MVNDENGADRVTKEKGLKTLAVFKHFMADNWSYFLLSLIIVAVLGLLVPSSKVIYITTSITFSQNITTTYYFDEVPLFTYLSTNPAITNMQIQPNSPIFDINYRLYSGENLRLTGPVNQIKADVITVKSQYSGFFNNPKGNLTVTIPRYAYAQVISIG